MWGVQSLRRGKVLHTNVFVEVLATDESQTAIKNNEDVCTLSSMDLLNIETFWPSGLLQTCSTNP